VMPPDDGPNGGERDDPPDGVNPYGSLEPESQEPTRPPLLVEASGVTVLLRGLRKRCPRCGERHIWDGWFTLRMVCPTCGLRFEKEQGGFLGAMALNYAVAVGAWLVVMVVGIVLTVPVIPVAPLLVASISVLATVPVWFYPRSKTIWAAIEFLVARGEREYRTPVQRDPRAKDLE
jgi:uncharacterized protein (DUF983 family)